MSDLPPVRRIVTTHDASGRAIVMHDAPAEPVVGKAGTRWPIWTTDGSPAHCSTEEDMAQRMGSLHPAPAGSHVRVVDFPPYDPARVPQDNGFFIRMSHLETEAAKARPSRHPLMHRTRTVDYAIILSGEIDMLLDEESVTCRVGDIIVQQATNHAWINRGTVPCRIAFILLDAEDPL